MQQIENLVKQVISKLFNTDIEVTLSRPDEQFGDYSTNVALKLAKQLNSNPREIANSICGQLSSELINKVEVAGPGFINITLTDKALVELSVSELAKSNPDQTVVIETNNPNPFKAMHIGHAFNAILADTIANLIEISGAHTYRVSYHGDVGLHVGKSMYSLLKFVGEDIDKLNQIPVSERNSFMSKMYAEGSTAYKENELAKQDIEELTKKSFTREDPVYSMVYDICKAWSFEQIDRDIARLGNVPVERRFLESDAELRGVKIVKDNVPRVFKESNGALIFEGSKYGSFDNAFVSNRGTGLYAARDLGLMQLKNEYYHPDKSYIVTAEEQRDYFKGVIAAAELCNPDFKDVTVNISTGTVKLSTGKMSSREGAVIEIDWLFDQVAQAIKSRGGNPDDDSVSAVLRYQFLQVRVGSDVVFDVEQAVSVQGNSGPYLQYAHARAKSILRKAEGIIEYSELAKQELTIDERSLVRKIGEYNDELAKSISELMPHYVCNYLYELAQTFNRFYEKNRVIGDDRQELRLCLVQEYAKTLKTGLGVLGIIAPEQM